MRISPKGAGHPDVLGLHGAPEGQGSVLEGNASGLAMVARVVVLAASIDDELAKSAFTFTSSCSSHVRTTRDAAGYRGGHGCCGVPKFVFPSVPEWTRGLPLAAFAPCRTVVVGRACCGACGHRAGRRGNADHGGITYPPSNPMQASPIPTTQDGDARAQAIALYLGTGDYDTSFRAWPGNVIERETRGHTELLQALVNRVGQLSATRKAPVISLPADLVGFTRKKVEPMVRGLFRKDEQELVLGVLEKSVVFLTPGNINRVLLKCTWLHTAWNLANLYLDSVGSELLGSEAHRLVGLSEETTCYVSTGYFEPGDRFADFIVHEAAHIFHNCKRRTVGLPETRTREWLLDIAYRKRETFAYACEAYARILELAPRPRDRAELAAEFGRQVRISADGVDASEVATTLAAAAQVRNGWKVILESCAPERHPGHRRQP